MTRVMCPWCTTACSCPRAHCPAIYQEPSNVTVFMVKEGPGLQLSQSVKGHMAAIEQHMRLVPFDVDVKGACAAAARQVEDMRHAGKGAVHRSGGQARATDAKVASE
ncbi:hypothetical protein PR202_gb04449 [Eleusine coracana subsp. coracana]|uniref:Uncharacterized protein n=1 Tax=Eleusine coracana subsp. coracana TaxID=191504 RepID=A0AAV5E3T8_ELECO|nr:hypothetical protein PR202_gb04449 [Eleusine coracana subsp. coracana]